MKNRKIYPYKINLRIKQDELEKIQNLMQELEIQNRSEIIRMAINKYQSNKATA